MKSKWIKYTGIACLLLSITTPALAQILRVQGRHVPGENMGKVIELETTYWSEVARKAIKDGHMSGWRLYQQIDGMNLDDEPNLFFVNEFTPEQIGGDENIWDFKKVFPDKEFSEIETFSMGTTKSVVYYYNLVSIAKSQPNFIRVNFAKTKNFRDLGRYLELEQSMWQPFIQEQMDSGKTNVVSWSLSRVLYPAGVDTEYDAITVDGFDTFRDALWTRYGDDVEFPDTGEIWEVHHKAKIHVYQLIMAVGPEE